MVRKAHLQNDLTSSQLKQKYLQTKEPVESRRWHLLWKIAQGWIIKNSAVAVGISYSYDRKIVSDYNQNGASGVTSKKRQNHSGGSQALLNEKQQEKLAQALKLAPSDGGIWTGPKVARWIEKETGVEKVWNQRGWDYLKKCNYSWQRPRPKHRKSDALQQKMFQKNLPILVKKMQQEQPDKEVEVWFFDVSEASRRVHRVGLKPILCKIWAPTGERPIATVQHHYEWLYVYGFVNPKTGETCWYLIPRVNSSWLSVVLADFAASVGVGENKTVLLVMDRAGWHLSTKLEMPPAIVPEFLPPYSPELQPAERLWRLVDEPIVNPYIESISELEDILSKRCCVLNNMREEIRNITDYHWLNYS